MGNIILDTYVLYQLCKALATPFKDLPAGKLGLIGPDGRRLRSARTPAEHAADTPFDRLTINVKRLIGTNVATTIGAAYFLLKEQTHATQWLTRPYSLFEAVQQASVTAKRLGLTEDGAPTNNAGSGAVAGLGTGVHGEPPGPARPRKKKRAVEAGRQTIGTVGLKEAEETFAGHRVFEVSPETYYRHRLGKKKYLNYRHAVGESEGDIGAAIKAHVDANPDQPVVLKNAQTGAMVFLRHGDRFHGHKQ